MDKIGLKFLDTTSHRARPRYSDAHLRIGRRGTVQKSLAARTLISTPSAGASLTKASIERTTPLICGSQASVMMRMRVNGKAGTGMLGRMWTLRDWTGLATCRLVTPHLTQSSVGGNK